MEVPQEQGLNEGMHCMTMHLNVSNAQLNLTIKLILQPELLGFDLSIAT